MSGTRTLALENAHRYSLAGLKFGSLGGIPVDVASELATWIGGSFGRLPIRRGLTGPELLSGGKDRFAATGDWA
jgi:hypothetical protein